MTGQRYRVARTAGERQGGMTSYREPCFDLPPVFSTIARADPTTVVRHTADAPIAPYRETLTLSAPYRESADRAVGNATAVSVTYVWGTLVGLFWEKYMTKILTDRSRNIKRRRKFLIMCAVQFRFFNITINPIRLSWVVSDPGHFFWSHYSKFVYPKNTYPHLKII